MTTPNSSPAPVTGRHYLITILGLLAPLLGTAASVIPAPESWLCSVAAVLAAGGAGLMVKVPTSMVGRPIVSPTMALAFASLSAALVNQAMGLPDGLAGAVALAGAAGVPLPTPGANAAAGAGVALVLVLLPLSLAGCATGPARATISEYVSPPEARRPLVAADAEPEQPKASPFSAGFMLAAGAPAQGGKLLPAQLAVGSLHLASVGPRSINLLALGGVSGTSVSEARGAWGFGAGVELTPGNLLYEVDLGAGALWMSGLNGPAIVGGFIIQPKM